MKILVNLVVLLFLPFICFSQSEINLDNNLTGIYSKSNSRNLDLSVNGQNFFSCNKFTLSSNTFYLLSLNDQSSSRITGNELMQRFSFDHQKNNIYKFIFYQYNSSLERNINSENWIGVGAGFKKKVKNSTFNLSYAFMYTVKNKNEKVLRHSFKFRYKIERKLFSFNTEYFFQPSIYTIKDYIIIGTTNVVLLPENKISFLIQNVLNIRSKEQISVLETLTLGLSVKFNKKFRDDKIKEN